MGAQGVKLLVSYIFKHGLKKPDTLLHFSALAYDVQVTDNYFESAVA